MTTLFTHIAHASHHETSAKASTEWQPGQSFFVAQVPGQGGQDWGYTLNPAQAIPLSRYWQQRFNADCAACHRTARFF